MPKNTDIKTSPIMTEEIPPVLGAWNLSLAIHPLQMILLAGYNQMVGLFPVHTGLMIKIRNAYRDNDRDAFLESLRVYLTQAHIRLTQIPPPTQIETLLARLEQDIDERSLAVVASMLLRGLP